MNETFMQRYGVGQPIRRKEDMRFLTGTGKFIDDVSIPGADGFTRVRLRE